MNKEKLLETFKTLLILYYSDSYDDCICQTIDLMIDSYDNTLLDRYLREEKKFTLTNDEISSILATLQPEREQKFFLRFVQESFYLKLYVFIQREL